MTTHERAPGSGDRERRAELEALQVELREAKAALTGAKLAEDPGLTALREAVVRAGERRAAALARRQALQGEEAALQREVERLKRDLEEEEALARGARMRHTGQDWANYRMRDGTYSTVAAQLGVAGFFFVMICTLLLLSLCGSH